MPPELVLRPAEPNAEDGAAFAMYLDIAADGVFRMLLGRDADRIIAKAYVEPGHDLSFETATFAELDGVRAGMFSGYTSERHAQSSDKPLSDAAGIAAVRMAVVSVLGRGLLRFMDNIPSGDFYLQAVAVDEVARGRGVGSVLIDAAEQTATTAGCHRLALDVDVSNDAAKRLYERRGMIVEAESPSILFTPGSGVLRMVKDL